HRAFRTQLVNGNERIDHIITRTTIAMTDALEDVEQGLSATKELARYLIQLDVDWPKRSGPHNEVYLAMKGNAEGWYRCFMKLQSKGKTLSTLLSELSGVVAETQRRVGVASRKQRVRAPFTLLYL